MNTSRISSQRLFNAEKGIRPKATAVTGRQMTINGILRPILVWVLSLMALKTGIRNMARILSKVMIDPIRALDSTKRARKIGT
jgi:flagellar biosynthesis/type III secretory pathway M-ring protein FliF/YscJ